MRSLGVLKSEPTGDDAWGSPQGLWKIGVSQFMLGYGYECSFISHRFRI
jgi:hypothetical protein